jgi:hypothetical protein
MPYIDNLESSANVTGRRALIRRRRIGSATTQTARPSLSAPVNPNPTRIFTAQADIVVSWIKKSAGTAATKMPFAIFGKSDSFANYAKWLQNTPNVDSSWIYAGFFIYPAVPSAIVTGGIIPGAVIGDGVFLYFNPADGSGGSWVCVLIHCNQVAYATLLDATNSDRFVISTIRYSLPNPSALTQYGEQINYLYQGLFGKSVADSLNPLSYKNPEQFQNATIDIPLGSNGWGVDKASEFGGYIIPSQVMTWSIFIESETRLSAA